MLQPDRQNKNARDDIKAAWYEGDIIGLLRAGFDNFLNLISSDAPLPFQKFLEYTGSSFDHYIMSTTKQESLIYVGGKMILEIVPCKTPDADLIQLSADLYFQTLDRKWVMKKKSGQVTSERFSDWTTDAKALQLQAERKIELSIELPESET